MSDKQRTIKNPISLNGKGLHTGQDCVITFKPAPENHGYKFQRIDLDGQPTINAIVENVVDTSRGTTLEENGAKIYTCEHLLAAVYGLDIDNILIEINADEVPILDGSAILYIDALKKAGIVEQSETKKYFTFREKIQYQNEEKNIELTLYPEDSFNINVMVDYNSDVVTNQFASLYGIESFASEIASSRTFVFLHELEYLYKNNLIKGGDFDNAIVYVDKDIEQKELDKLADLFNKPRISIVPNKGILNNVDLKFNNEAARHKLLDLVGDLALIGYRINGRIIANKPGHFSNIEFAKAIKQQIKKQNSKNKAPVFDLNKPPVLDINQIKELLPHRPPFLLVDKIVEIDEESIVGIKNVTMNESFFVGHFPDEPVMPGVLQIEAMAQIGGLFCLNSIDNPKDYLTFFMTIDNVKFKRKVVPGDTLIFQVKLKSEVRRGIASLIGKAFVGENLVMEGELMAQLVKKQ